MSALKQITCPFFLGEIRSKCLSDTQKDVYFTTDRDQSPRDVWLMISLKNILTNRKCRPSVRALMLMCMCLIVLEDKSDAGDSLIESLQAERNGRI